MSDYQKQKITMEIVDLIYKNKIYLDEEFSIFEPSESNVTIQRFGHKVLKTIHGSQETDGDDLWEGSIFLRQTEFDFIDIEIHFEGSRNSYFNIPVTEGTMSFNSNNEKVFHYSFTSPADSLFMDIQIYEDFTKIQFPPGRININSKGYSSFDPNFTSILLKVPQLNIGFKDAKKKRPIRRSPEISPERMEQIKNQQEQFQQKMSQRMNSDEGKQRMREMQEKMNEQRMKSEFQKKKWDEKKQESDEKCEIGFNFLAQGKTDKAIKSFKDAISIISWNMQARHDLWDAYDNFKKDYQESEELFKDLIKSHEKGYHPTLHGPGTINWIWDWLYLGLSVYRQGYYLEAGLYFTLITESVPRHWKYIPPKINIERPNNQNFLNDIPDVEELRVPFDEAETYLNEIKQIPMDIINDEKHIRWPIIPHDEVRWSRRWFNQDSLLLMKILRIFGIVAWIKIEYVSKILEISNEKLLEKIKMWNEGFSFKVEEEYLYCDKMYEHGGLFEDSFLLQQREEIRKDAIESSVENIAHYKCKRCNSVGNQYTVIQDGVAVLACTCNFCDTCIHQVRKDHFKNIYVKWGASKEERIKLIYDKWKELGIHKGIKDKELYEHVKKMVEGGF